MNKRTKIVCTLGPACETKEIITSLVNSGMNVARLNFSHGTHENHKKLIDNVRSVEDSTNEHVPILQDLQGPKIRVGELPEEGITLKEGESVTFDTSISKYENGVIPIDYKDLHTFIKEKERILLFDGRLETVVTKVESTKIITNVVVGGKLSSHKGINIPDSKVNVRSFTEKDKKDAAFGVEHGVDMMALSFVTTPNDILDLRYYIQDKEKELGIKRDQPIQIIAKIERKEAVEAIDEILDVADGIMIARGDLGIEIPAQDVPLVQKKLIDKGLLLAKPVIVATQMLDSMRENPRPTRAEVSDVANAVIDHADAVMLSNETATGKYPKETVKTMAKIISETESSHYDNLDLNITETKKDDTDDVISQLSRLLAEQTGAKLILAASLSGETARLISRHRPELPIVVATHGKRSLRQMNLSWGVTPFLLPMCHSIEELVERGMVFLKEQKLAKTGDSIVVVAGEPVGQAGQVNVLEIRHID